MTNEEKEILDKSLWAERVIKKHIDLYNNILAFNSAHIISFKQKVYNYYNNIYDIPACLICGKEVKFHNKKYNKYCSNTCSSNDSLTKDSKYEKIKETIFNRYGVNSVFHVETIKEKIIATNNDRWGFDKPAKSSIIKAKISNTKLNKTDAENLLINKKRSDSVLEKYGVDNVAKSDVIKEKTIESNIQKWGTSYPIQLNIIKDKRRENYYQKHGVNHHFHVLDNINSMQANRKMKLRENYLDSISHLNLDVKEYEQNELSILCDLCNTEYIIPIYLLNQRTNNNLELCTNCNPLNNKTSSYHREVLNFLKELGVTDNIIINDRLIIGKELDIHLPDFNLAIEINDLYWHSEIYKDKSYHLDKTNKCNQLSIELIHIFEDDWLYKKDIIKSILRNRLNITTNKIFARKCVVKEITDPKLVKSFLNTNHIQGYSSSKIKLGLFYEDNLVSLMTFSTRYINAKNEFELVRFCNVLNTNVIGGASKLFKYFINNYDYSSITSYTEVSIFNGSLYKTLGFNFQHRSKVNYYWVVDNVRKHRFNYNKTKLINNGYDSNKTEVQIMHERGFYRIWGCGQDKYLFMK